MGREKFLAATCLIAAITAADSLFAADLGEPERINDKTFMDDLLDGLNTQVSRNQLENTVAVLNMALARHP